MSTERAFLQGIIENPESDTHRLVFADWLDETGVPQNADRAEFIRIQCRLAGLAPDAPDRPELTNREQSLLKIYAKQWAEPFRELVSWWTFRRGFLDGAVVRTDGMGKRFVPLFRQLVEGTPLRAMALFEQFGKPEILLPAAPYMTRLREFGVRHGHLHEEGAAYRKLLHSEHLAGLTCLDMEGSRNGSWFRPRTLCAILKSPVLTGLTTLLLSDYITELDPGILSTIAKSQSLANLRRLGIMNTPFDEDRMRDFTRAAFADKLEILELQFCDIAEGAWQLLLSEKAFPNLKRLYLAGTGRGEDEDERQQVLARFGPDALNTEQEDPARPWYHSWWEE